MNKKTNCKRNVSLSPPWYILRNQFAYTLGKSPFIKVNELIETNDKTYLLYFKVSNFKIATALRQVIYEIYPFGNIKVVTIVIGPDEKIIPFVPKEFYTPKEIAYNISMTMYKNPIYADVLSFFPSQQLSLVVCIIKRKVVQFYADNLSDFCLNYLEVASKVVTSILKNSYPGKDSSLIRVFYTTKDKNCIQYKY